MINFFKVCPITYKRNEQRYVKHFDFVYDIKQFHTTLKYTKYNIWINN